MPFLLFSTVALAWGFTWYAIRLQLGPTPDIVSVFWRFAVAAAVMWLGLALTGRLRPAPVKLQPWFAAMGATLFSGNFLLIYGAEHDVPSGLVAVVFSMASLFNVFNQWCFRGIRPAGRTVLGAGLGVAGVMALFAHQIAAGGQAHDARGVVSALCGTYLFSLGNLVFGRLGRAGVSLPNAIARGMSWGAVLLGAGVVLEGSGFAPAGSMSYLGGLAYLAVIGSVVGFLAYLSLVSRIGPAKAAYATVVSPLIALAMSALLEGYDWSAPAISGIGLVLAGNVVIFTPSLRRPALCAAPLSKA